MSVSSKSLPALGASRVAGHRIAERLRPHRPAQPGTVPISIDHLTPEWLTAALCTDVPGAPGPRRIGSARIAFGAQN